MPHKHPNPVHNIRDNNDEQVIPADSFDSAHIRRQWKGSDESMTALSTASFDMSLGAVGSHGNGDRPHSVSNSGSFICDDAYISFKRRRLSHHPRPIYGELGLGVSRNWVCDTSLNGLVSASGTSTAFNNVCGTHAQT